MPYKRGDVVLILFLDSNLRTAKRRPALVIQADDLNTGLRQSIVAMITSNKSKHLYKKYGCEELAEINCQ